MRGKGLSHYVNSYAGTVLGKYEGRMFLDEKANSELRYLRRFLEEQEKKGMDVAAYMGRVDKILGSASR